MENETLSEVLERLSRKSIVLPTCEDKLLYMVKKNPAVVDLIKELEMEMLY